MPQKVALMATLDTKSGEAEYLQERLERNDLEVSMIDISIMDKHLMRNDHQKLVMMDQVISKSAEEAQQHLHRGMQAIVAIGGGTGGEMAARIMQTLPMTFPKVLISTFPFDPRLHIADTSIILIPTLIDICGLNNLLREILDQAAAMVVGLCKTPRTKDSFRQKTSIGITALGATEDAIAPLVTALQERHQETTVFHANGLGGAVLSRFINQGALQALVDFTPHELTRLLIAGVHAPMPERFRAGADLPRIVLPGGLNLLGLGEAASVPKEYLERPHYKHSRAFTHVQLSPSEMQTVSKALIDSLNALSGDCTLIIPMGGFSHQDCPDGAIESIELRHLFQQIALENAKPSLSVISLDCHINSTKTRETILNLLQDEPYQRTRN